MTQATPQVRKPKVQQPKAKAKPQPRAKRRPHPTDGWFSIGQRASLKD